MCIPNKVLIITPFWKPNIGGAETFAEDLSKALSKKYIVHVNSSYKGRWTRLKTFKLYY